MKIWVSEDEFRSFGEFCSAGRERKLADSIPFSDLSVI